jgi:FtsH-binding integral membrane protein
MGSFMVMGLWAIVIAGIVNIFMRSSALGFAVSLLGAVIFIGLTAYDVQKFKALGYLGFRDGAERRKAALVGALHLYLDFVNLFLSLLRLFGNRR